jgi:hypothetical protein
MPLETLGCRKARGVKKLRRSDDLDAQQTPVRIEIQHDVAPAYPAHDDLFNGSTGCLAVCHVQIGGVCFNIQLNAHNAFHHIKDVVRPPRPTHDRPPPQ